MNKNLQAYQATGKGENCSFVDATKFVSRFTRMGFVVTPIFASPIAMGTLPELSFAEAQMQLGATDIDELFYMFRVSNVRGVDSNEGQTIATCIAALGDGSVNNVELLLTEMFGGGPNPVNITALQLSAITALPQVQTALKSALS